MSIRIYFNDMLGTIPEDWCRTSNLMINKDRTQVIFGGLLFMGISCRTVSVEDADKIKTEHDILTKSVISADIISHFATKQLTIFFNLINYISSVLKADFAVYYEDTPVIIRKDGNLLISVSLTNKSILPFDTAPLLAQLHTEYKTAEKL